MNHSVLTDQQHARTFHTESNVLCRTCSSNQQLKIKQMADFVPFDEVGNIYSTSFVVLLPSDKNLYKYVSYCGYEVFDSYLDADPCTIQAAMTYTSVLYRMGPL